MKKLFYGIICDTAEIECFKLLDVDELTDNAYEIRVTNKEIGESDFVTASSPQAAMALADKVRAELSITP